MQGERYKRREDLRKMRGEESDREKRRAGGGGGGGGGGCRFFYFSRQLATAELNSSMMGNTSG